MEEKHGAVAECAKEKPRQTDRYTRYRYIYIYVIKELSREKLKYKQWKTEKVVLLASLYYTPRYDAWWPLYNMNSVAVGCNFDTFGVKFSPFGGVWGRK